jgi:hypothetical protein
MFFAISANPDSYRNLRLKDLSFKKLKDLLFYIILNEQY